MITIRQYTDTGGSAESDIYAICTQFLISLTKGGFKGPPDFHKGRYLKEIVVNQLFLQMTLHEHRQTVLKECTHVSTIGSMSITDSEVVAMLYPHYMWIGDIGVLIDLVGVVRIVATLGGEGEFRYHIA